MPLPSVVDKPKRNGYTQHPAAHRDGHHLSITIKPQNAAHRICKAFRHSERQYDDRKNDLRTGFLNLRIDEKRKGMMTFDAFAMIDGIEGESTDEKHQGWIELLSYKLGTSQKKRVMVKSCVWKS